MFVIVCLKGEWGRREYCLLLQVAHTLNFGYSNNAVPFLVQPSHTKFVAVVAFFLYTMCCCCWWWFFLVKHWGICFKNWKALAKVEWLGECT